MNQRADVMLFRRASLCLVTALTVFASTAQSGDEIACATDTCGDHAPSLFDSPCSDNILKDIPLCGGFKATVGGELRYRYLDEHDRLRPGSDVRSTYSQWRFVPYLEAGNDSVKALVQAIDASTFGNEAPLLPIDVNRADLLRYWVDVKVLDLNGGAVRSRTGRQFLKYGSQHLVSPLAWANTYRNFEGTKLYWSNSNWSVDGFATRGVNAPANNLPPHRRSSDSPDQSSWFSGLYATYTGMKNQTVDLYWLWLDEDEPKDIHDGSRHTIGLRLAGSHAVKDCGRPHYTLDWDMEGAWQFGKDDFPVGGANQDVSAGFFSFIGGTTLHTLPWTPTIKGVFWWGSGDSDPTDDEINTVSTLFPLGHAYWGILDNFNGSNLIDYAVQVDLHPAEKLTFTGAWHWFDKATTTDTIYNIASASLGPIGAPRHIGTELDLIATWKPLDDVSVQTGYSWFWYGDAVTTTALNRDDAHQFYTMVTWGF